MKKALRWIINLLCLGLGILGQAFIILSFLMLMTNVGQRPWPEFLIGIILTGISLLVSIKILPRCPRCGSREIEENKCIICDCDLNKQNR